MIDKKIKLGIIVTVSSAIVFGLYPPTIQYALREGANSSFTIIVSTFFRALSLVAFCIFQGYKVLPQRREIATYVRGGFFQALSIFGILGSLAFIPGPITIIIMFTHTIILLLFLAVTGEQKFNKLSVISTLCAFIGVSFVVNVWQGSASTLDPKGVVLAVVAAVATASRLYVFGKQVRDTNPGVVGARIFLVTFLFSLLLLLIETPTLPSSLQGLSWFGLACSSLALGTFGMFYAISLLGSFRFALLIKLEPVFTAIFSFLILKEILLPIQYIGMGLVILSLVSYQMIEGRRANS
jgi:drug/metabolite transporter (DMT)-like permease